MKTTEIKPIPIVFLSNRSLVFKGDSNGYEFAMISFKDVGRINDIMWGTEKPIAHDKSKICGACNDRGSYWSNKLETWVTCPCNPIAHDKTETEEMECAAFKRMMSEGSSDIMSKIIASENKSMERDFEIWWKQEWSFGEEPSAAKVYSILKKCTKSAIEERRKLEDKISDLEWKLVNDKATESINLPRLLDWIKNREKPAHLAFTESIERQIAYAVEMAVHDKAEACNKDDKLPDIYSTISYSSSAWNTSEQWHEVYCGGEIVFKTRNKYEANMFEAELKNKLSGFQGSREASKDNKIESLEEKVKELEKANHDLRVNYVLQNPCTDRADLEAEVARLTKENERLDYRKCKAQVESLELKGKLDIATKSLRAISLLDNPSYNIVKDLEEAREVMRDMIYFLGREPCYNTVQAYQKVKESALAFLNRCPSLNEADKTRMDENVY